MTYDIHTPTPSPAGSHLPSHLRQLVSTIQAVAARPREDHAPENKNEKRNENESSGAVHLPPPLDVSEAPAPEPAAVAVVEEPFLGELKDMLVQLCLIGDRDADGQATLQAQSEMLNNLFARTIYRTFHGKDRKGEPIEDYFNDEKMALALQIQKQTAETLRIHSARRYMDSIHHNDALVPTPLPQTWEQNDQLK